MTSVNSFNVLIGKSLTRQVGVQITDASATSTYIQDGEIVVLNHLDAPLTAGQTISDAPFIRIVQRSGSKLVFSARIKGTSMKRYTGKSGAAGAEQVSVLGYNGSAGSIDLTTVSKLLKIVFTHDQLMYNGQPMRKVYQSTALTQAEVANDIATIMNQDSLMALMGSGGASSSFISVEVLCNNAGTAITGTGTIRAVKGSTTITAGTDIDAVMAVGDWIRINSTATTGSMYKIISMNTTAQTAELSMPYQGATATVAEATNEYVSAANMATAACGLKMTGLPLTSSIVPSGEFNYMKVAFVINPGTGWGATTLATTTSPSLGNGTFPQVRYMEYFGLKFEGAQNQTILPLPVGRADATSGVLYDSVVLTYVDTSEEYPISGTRPAPQDLYMFFVDGAPQTGTVLGQLNPWMNSTPAALPSIGAL